MLNMSFYETQAQIRARSKSVTRRAGWLKAKSGLFIQAVVKGQGIPKGEHVEKLTVIKVVGARREPLCRLTEDLEYGAAEMVLEGFPGRDPAEFVSWFCGFNMFQPEWPVTRIEFDYV